MKPPTQRRAAIAALLLAPALTACGFNAQTDQVYQPAVGVNDRDGSVDIINALVVSETDGSGTFAGTLVNNDQSNDDSLESVSGNGITAPRRTVEVPAAGAVPLGESGAVSLEGDDIKAGGWVELTFVFSSGQSTTMKVPVVEATGDYADVRLPSPSSSASPTKAPKSSPSSSPTESPTGSPTESPSSE